MATVLLVEALAALSLPALAAAAVLAVLTVRLRRARRRDAARVAQLQRRLACLEAARAELERTAATDPLTGVANYRQLQLTLDREVQRALRTGRPLAVLLLDVDGFATINAAHGHPRGSAVLRDVAQRLAVEIRRTDTLGRYGGEEFLVLLPGTGAEGAVRVAERLCWSVRRHRLPLPDHPAPERAEEQAEGRGWQLTASVGIAVLPADGGHAATLLRAAGQALGEAKRAGGDRWYGIPPSETVRQDPAAGGEASAPGEHHLITDSAHSHLGVSAPQ